MTHYHQDPVTQLLSSWRSGDDTALGRLIPLVYDELRRVAAVSLRREDPGHTLQPTALVHEFYLQAESLRGIDWACRSHFIGTAARVMRNILVDSARSRKAAKRGGGNRDPLDELELPSLVPSMDIICVDLALDKLAVQHPRHAQVTELIFFGGLNAAETANVLSGQGPPVSARTVERDWRFARAWLQNELAHA
jgi:RNA polymerase sigma-70 factor, ECF subfamily